MATTSTNLLLTLLELGESSGSGYANWGEATNANLLKLEAGMSSRSGITVTTAAVTLTDEEANTCFLRVAGTKTANRNLIVPAREHLWMIKNLGSDNFNLTVKTPSGTGIVVPNGGVDILYCDGTDVLSILVGNVSRVMRSSDMPNAAPAGWYYFLCKNDSGNFGYARIASSNVAGFTAIT